MSVSGVTSYKDIEQLVETSVTKDREAVSRLEERKTNATQAKADWNSINSSLAAFKVSLQALQSSTTFYSKTATSSDTAVVSASSTSDAAITSYSLTGITLAKAASVSSETALGLEEGGYTYHQSTSDISDGGTIDANAKLNTSSSHIQDVGNLASGSFSINGVSILLDTTKDTLNTVLSKINSSTAEVTATFDSATKTIRITSNVEGAETISFSDPNNTNFFDVMNIDTLNETNTGANSDWETAITDVTEFSAISDGYFTINDITVEVDVSEDSLQDVINKINDSTAGVTAFYNQSLDKLVITSQETGEEINMSNDTSGFLQAMQVLDATGDQDAVAGQSTYDFIQSTVTVNGTELQFDSNTFEINGTTFTLHSSTASGVGANVQVARDTESAKTAITSFTTKYNALMSLIESKMGADEPLENDWLLSSMRKKLRSMVVNNVSNPGVYGYLRDIGVDYDSGRLSVNSATLTNALRDNPTSVYQILAYDSNNDGVRSDGGIANSLITDLVDPATYQYTGGVTARVAYLQTSIEKIAKDITAKETRIDTKKELLTLKYYRFMEAMQQMQQQQTWLQNTVWGS